MYGESPDPYRKRHTCMGLSPRVRGIHVGGQARIVPCAVRRVYPRVYGESSARSRRRHSWLGLSPRVRGIRPDQNAGAAQQRSIPACTGNPREPEQARSTAKVYPRVYGESGKEARVRPDNEGLSPRVRGIRRHGWRRASESGSIPACTGNPRRGPCAAITARVYPRVYGESCRIAAEIERLDGLSPRVRGIHPLPPSIVC